MSYQKKESPFIVVSDLVLNDLDTELELSALITASDDFFEPFRLWYRFSNNLKAHIPISGDPFLAALLPLAMNKKYDLIIQAPVSERLYINIRQIMKIMSDWYDNMTPIDVEANTWQKGSEGNPKAVGSFFTGGVDSFYTLLKNLDLYVGESRITYLLYVHGFDIKITNQELYETVRKVITSIADELNLESIFIKTNLRELTNNYTRWGEEQHGAALASAALCLQNLFRIIYIPSSVSYSELYKWGSHPLLDTLWSNEQTHFIHDGNEANRSQKILWKVSKSETALNHLRVCWKNPDNRYNCGVCGKCIRTKINLNIAGVLQKCKTLDNEFDTERYKKILLTSSVERRNLIENIEMISENNQQLEEKLRDIQRSIEKKRSSMNFKLKNLIKKFIPVIVKIYSRKKVS